ncbi:restriction endonuclease subunit S [Pantoea agglomerans]|uniref:restriction endonuclease subunit S n=3 Tax=Enterobacter agglomerans TaxID=549 RepID=UPI001F4E9BBB|nr:restriction endonuclease subunit S [Pantoea agglomerans]MCH9406755.1 restriction endonuclease subunit S [Pantoea agglomerans]WNK30183.1 restriction endonuclease subunit S [Pantoea agglomerans]WNK62085.1 restriction endonuclease subunit S [Pantoea agglomerans]
MTEQQLPEGWQVVKFGDIAKHISKRVEPSETDLEIYVGLEHLDPDSLKIKRYGTPSDVEGQKLLVKKGQIIFGKRRAYQRKVAVADWDCICSAHAMVLEANPENIIPEFLPFFLQSEIFMNRAVAISEGSLSPTIKWRTLSSQYFVFPSMERQKELIPLLKKIVLCNSLSDEIGQSHEDLEDLLLVDFVNNINKSSCELLSLSEVSKRITVGIVNKPADLYVSATEGILTLRSQNIKRGNLCLNNVVYISKDGHEKNKKSQLSAGDIAVVRTGYPGTACVIPEGSGELNSIDILILSVNRELLLPDYVVAFINSPLGKSQILEGAGGLAQQHFNVNALKKMKIIIPPLSEQQKLVKILDSIKNIASSVIATNKSRKTILESLRASLD